jgi:hypothetical protein
MLKLKSAAATTTAGAAAVGEVQYDRILSFIFRCLTDPLERFQAQDTLIAM